MSIAQQEQKLECYVSPADKRLGWASIYISNRWFPVPVPPRAKGPVIGGWQYFRLTEAELPKHFDGAGNIGLLLGTVSGGLSDVDLDAKEALAAADTFLLPTKMVSGRQGKPRSHRWYLPSPTPKLIQFKDPLIEDPRKATLVELRADPKNGKNHGLQTIVPPSIHKETGEPIRWEGPALEPARIPAQELITAVTHTAVCALIARYWPCKGEHGHEMVLTLSGALLRAGLKLDTVKKIITTAARIAGYPRAKEADIDDTARNLADGRPVTGWPKLGELMDSKIVAQLAKWVGGKGQSNSHEPKHNSEKGRWLLGMICTKEGVPKALLANVITALRQDLTWKGVLAYNASSLYVVTKAACPFPKEVGSNWTDSDDILTTDWMQHNGICVRETIVAAAVQAVAKECTFHPVRDYLNGLVWDNTPRLVHWLIDYLGAPATPYVRAVGKCWLISAVARVFRPGCQADHTLMLQGPQGAKKSTALRTLASDPWFTDHISDLQNKDARLELRGKLIVELAEMDRLRRAESERVKSFLTTRIDSFRPPYGRRVETFPRECVFAASTNEQTPFVDPTGNRRFWPVECGEINVDGIVADRDQLWAEACSHYRAGAKWWLESKTLIDAATEEQESRYDTGVWDEAIAMWVENPKERFDKDGVPLGSLSSTKDQVTISDILVHAIGKTVDRHTQQDKNAVGRCLTHWKWRRGRLGTRTQRKYFYLRPTGME